MDVTETLEIVTDVTMMGLLIRICRLFSKNNIFFLSSLHWFLPDMKVGPNKTESTSRPLMSTGIVFCFALLTCHTELDSDQISQLTYTVFYPLPHWPSSPN